MKQVVLLTLACNVAGIGAQSPATRDSAGIRIVQNAVPKSALIWRTVDPAPLVTLGGKSAKGKAAFSGVQGAVRLSNGDIVVTDADNARIVFFDARGVYRYSVDVVGAGGQRAAPEALVPVGHDSMAQWDGDGNRLTILNASGRAVQLRRIENPPYGPEYGGHSRALIHVVGLFGSGGVLGTVHGPFTPPPGQAISESVMVYHANVNGKLDTLGKFLRGERFGFAKQTIVWGQLPLGRNGSFTVAADAWFYTDGAAYTIQRRAPSGRLLSEFRLDRAREPVTASVVAHMSRARLIRSTPLHRATDSLALEWMSFPRTEPAYTALQVDADHRIWARAWSFDDEPSKWDVFDPNGRFLGTVAVPSDLEVLEIGSDYLLAKYTYDPNVDEVRMYRVHP